MVDEKVDEMCPMPYRPRMDYSTTKKGRPQGFHRTSWGERIHGLTRLADGRWKVSGPKAVKFSEADERLAVARYQAIRAKEKSNLGEVAVHGNAVNAMHDLAKRTIDAGGSLQAFPVPAKDGSGAWAVSDANLSPAQWAWLRGKLLTEPKWVALQVGLEKIGWYQDLQKPAESPKLSDLIDLYVAKPGMSTNEVSRSKLFWTEFTKAVGIERIREITHEHVAAYEKVVSSGKYAPKSILHRHSKVRTVLAYAIKRGRGVEDCRRALDVTAMLEVKNAQPLDPKPINVADFWKLHKAATDAGDVTFAALMLTAFNCAMYGGEVSALKWDEINLKTGELVTRRPKTGVSRVAVLWPEVLTALRKIERKGDFVFNTSRRPYVVNSALKAWRKYRTAANLPEEVVFGQIRDAAYTVACRCSLDQARVLAGHRLPGMTDNYVRRDPSFVADACRAIREHVYPNKAGKRKTGAA